MDPASILFSLKPIPLAHKSSVVDRVLLSTLTVLPFCPGSLRLLKLERVKDYLLMEEEFVKNQERLKPTDDTAKEELNKVKNAKTPRLFWTTNIINFFP